jgi:hypothetical protein
MLIQLTGVVRSGGRPSLRVPPDARQGLPILAAMTNRVLLTVVDQQGAAVDLSSAGLTLTVKRSPRDLSSLLSVAGVVLPELGPNLVEFSLSPAQTASWRTTGYCYDVVLQRLDGSLEAVIPTSPLYVTPATYGGVSPGPGPTPTPSAVRGTVPAPGGPYPAIPAGTPVAILDGIVLIVADAGNPAAMPAVGLYTGATTNSVRTDGVAEGLVGLPLDAPVFVAVGGGLTGTAPSVSGQTVQRLGKSIGTTNVFVEPGVSVRLA